jgi:hypothetical protein
VQCTVFVCPISNLKNAYYPYLHKKFCYGSVISAFPRIKEVITMRSYNI